MSNSKLIIKENKNESRILKLEPVTKIYVQGEGSLEYESLEFKQHSVILTDKYGNSQEITTEGSIDGGKF